MIQVAIRTGFIFTVVVLHLKSKEFLLNTLTKKPTLIVGDFNDTPGSKVYAKMSEYNFHSCYESLEKRGGFFTTCKKRELLIIFGIFQNLLQLVS